MKLTKLSFSLTLVIFGLLLSGAADVGLRRDDTSQKVRPDKHEGASTKEQTGAQDQQDQARFQTEFLQILGAIANQNKTAYEQGRADEKSWQSPSVLVNLGLLLVGAVYTAFACLQWRAIHRQANIA